MNHSRFLLLLLFTPPFALGQAAYQAQPASLPNDPKALVRNLYKEVVALHPLGSPGGAAIKVFAPYLSNALLHRIDINVACQDDWDRQHPDRNSKPPFLEFGLFSGDDLRAEPGSFHIERVQSDKDGSFLVYVRLTRGVPPEDTDVWHVEAIVIREDGHFVVDDVIYVRDRPQGVDVRLSEYLSQGCDGPRWVGCGEQRNDLK